MLSLIFGSRFITSGENSGFFNPDANIIRDFNDKGVILDFTQFPIYASGCDNAVASL
jgi:hypothetical protein